MDLTRHLFTVVLTLASEGSGRCEWRKIAEDGQELQEVVSSTMPALGNLAIHGLTCNNELAHRVFWDEGRRLALACATDKWEKKFSSCVSHCRSCFAALLK
ncbi:unnamed protein product [Durusdinium trenchii]